MKYYFQCPNCGSDDRFVRPSEQTSNLGCLLFFFGGLIPLLLFADHTHSRIQCTHCSHIFRQPALPSSPFASFAGWILALVIVPTIAAAFFFASPELADLLPSIPIIATIEKAVTMQPRVAAYLLAVLFVLVVIPCWAAACLSNAKFRKQLSAAFRVKPLSSRELACENSRQRRPSTEETRGA